MSGISNISQSGHIVTVDGNSLQTQKGEVGQPLTLKNGDIIQGKVVSVNDTAEGKVVNINVSGNEISAKLREDMNLQEGQTLNFAVKGLGTKAISIMPLYENTSALQSTIKALSAAGLESSYENIQMVKEMMEAGLPIDKSSLLEMSKNLNVFSETNVSTLVEMKTLGIPINENNINGYESYKNYEHQVVNEIENITGELPMAFNELIESGEKSKAMNLYGSVLKLFGEEGSAGETTPQGEIVSESSESGISGNIQENAPLDTASNLQPEAKAQTGDALSKNPELSDNIQADKETAPNIQDKLPQGANDELSDFASSLKRLGISDETVAKYVNAQKSGADETASKQLLQELAKSYEAADLSSAADSEAWKSLFKSEGFNKLLKDNISQQWLLKPGDVEDKANVENLYQRLGNQVKHLTDTINNTIGAESKLGQAANNLSNNLDFMNQLNQMFQYVQLPLQMTGQNVHGDLYVYKNKHKKMSEDGSVSAVLHLDMDNLGPVDVYVKMVEKKVSTNFYVADESVLDLINDNIHILNERLEKRGYSMNVTMKLHDDMDGEDAAVDEMFDVNKTPILSTASFDARA